MLDLPSYEKFSKAILSMHFQCQPNRLAKISLEFLTAVVGELNLKNRLGDTTKTAVLFGASVFVIRTINANSSSVQKLERTLRTKLLDIIGMKLEQFNMHSVPNLVAQRQGLNFLNSFITTIQNPPCSIALLKNNVAQILQSCPVAHFNSEQQEANYLLNLINKPQNCYKKVLERLVTTPPNLHTPVEKTEAVAPTQMSSNLWFSTGESIATFDHYLLAEDTSKQMAYNPLDDAFKETHDSGFQFKLK